MGHGFTNAADSLTAIRKLVYREKRLTLAQVVAALDADFEGHEATHKLLISAPKFGNDEDEADLMLAQMWRDMNTAVREAGTRAGLDFLTVSSVNPGGYWMGQSCGATADGRHKGQSFAIGHAPTAGLDKSGLTALFNSVAKVDADNGGATTNFKLSPDWFKGPKSQAETMFKVYFARGGQEATITVVNRGDLEAALKEPEKYPHVLVRLGGWSARFIDLEKAVQLEILQRTQY
jgi:pyruvate-formate lyase